jgi:hypothetical protein
MEFPAFAGKSYDLIIFQGSKSITVVQDTIPQNGKFKLTIPISKLFPTLWEGEIVVLFTSFRRS